MWGYPQSRVTVYVDRLRLLHGVDVAFELVLRTSGFHREFVHNVD
jgi:hypothetical protein